MKEPLSYEKWVTKFVHNVASHFNLSGWMINVQFSDEMKGSSYAEATVNTDYSNCVIHCYKPVKMDFESGNMDFVVASLVHELIHIFMDPFHQFAEPYLSPSNSPFFMSIVEQQTQKLTMVILKTLPKNLIPPR